MKLSAAVEWFEIHSVQRMACENSTVIYMDVLKLFFYCCVVSTSMSFDVYVVSQILFIVYVCTDSFLLYYF